MKTISILIQFFVNAFFLSATPNRLSDLNFGGSKDRIDAKKALADKAQAEADATGQDIQVLQNTNPFETASAKSAMATSSMKAKQTQQRFANMMGSNASPEAMISAQQATQNAVSGTAGDIAVGAEAQKKAEITQLRTLKARQSAQAAGLEQAAANEIGSGIRDAYSAFAGPLAGAVKGGSSAAAS